MLAFLKRDNQNIKFTEDICQTLRPTSLARVIISGVKFTFNRRMFPLPACRDLALSMPNILPPVANGLLCTFRKYIIPNVNQLFTRIKCQAFI